MQNKERNLPNDRQENPQGPRINTCCPSPTTEPDLEAEQDTKVIVSQTIDRCKTKGTVIKGFWFPELVDDHALASFLISTRNRRQ